MKYFCERFTIIEISPIETGRIRSATNVINGLILSIMISTPMIVVTDVITCVALWFRLWLKVSISFVIRDNTSPCVCLSK